MWEIISELFRPLLVEDRTTKLNADSLTQRLMRYHLQQLIMIEAFFYPVLIYFPGQFSLWPFGLLAVGYRA
jgi:hypothetical protein